MNARARTGFIGVGLMGEGMCRCLLQAGYPLAVLAHRSRTRIDRLVAEGASEAANAEELARSSDIIIMCVSNARAVEQAVEAMRPGLSAGKFIVDTTTSEPELTRRLAAELAQDGVVFCDAPLAGGAAQAAQANWAFFSVERRKALPRLNPFSRHLPRASNISDRPAAVTLPSSSTTTWFAAWSR
jgi:3-hydroxyisobutyrate dehydrogenase-like beta-hydroxyacid dehydrogenase